MSMLDIKTGQNHIAKIESHSFVDGEGNNGNWVR